MQINDKIYIAGHAGLVGSNLLNKLEEYKFKHIIKARRNELDLTNRKDVFYYFNQYRPEYVILAAAKVGGIYANNTYPADFITDNIEIQTNIIKACYKFGVKKLLFLGSSCIYPRECEQPIKEEYLMSGKLEKTNSAYAMAKICGIEMCRAYNKQYGTNYICAMPCNLMGVGDHFDLNNSHVLQAIIRKMHEAKINNKDIVELWGDGSPKREFLYAEDLADGLVFLMRNFNASDDNLINIGSGEDISIKDLADMIKEVVGYMGNITWNGKMNGTPRKVMNCEKINKLGWKPKFSLLEGIEKTYNWYKKVIDQQR